MGLWESFIKGRSVPLVYKGVDVIAADPGAGGGGAARTFVTTDWMQVGYTHADTGTSSDNTAFIRNRLLAQYGAQYYSLSVIYGRGSGDGANVHIDSAYAEFAWDTTAAQPLWNADHSNIFIIPGAYDSSAYGSVYNQPLTGAKPLSGYVYSLTNRTGGGYMRIHWIRGLAVSLDQQHTIEWVLTCFN